MLEVLIQSHDDNVKIGLVQKQKQEYTADPIISPHSRLIFENYVKNTHLKNDSLFNF